MIANALDYDIITAGIQCPQIQKTTKLLRKKRTKKDQNKKRE